MISYLIHLQWLHAAIPLICSNACDLLWQHVKKACQTFWCWSQYKLLEVWSLPTYKGTPPWELTSIFHDFLECTPCRHLHVVIPLHHNRHYNELIRLILTKYALSYVCDVPFGNGRRIQCLRNTLLFQPSTCWGYYQIVLGLLSDRAGVTIRSCWQSL